MKLDKAFRRDRKIQKRRYGMREDGRSVKLLHDIQKQKAEAIKQERELAEATAELTLDLYEESNEQKRRDSSNSG